MMKNVTSIDCAIILTYYKKYKSLSFYFQKYENLDIIIIFFEFIKHFLQYYEKSVSFYYTFNIFFKFSLPSTIFNLIFK